MFKELNDGKLHEELIFFSGGTDEGNELRLVCVCFLAALNVYLGGDKMISENAMSVYFRNLSMQALSKSDDAIVIKFDAINRLNKSLNDLLMA